MDPRSFVTTEYGDLRFADEDRYWWFDPAPLPDRLLLDPDTLIALSEADAALGRLAGVGGMLKDPRLIARPAAVREALASAQIEGTQASLSEVYQAESGGRIAPSDADIRMVSRHIRALETGLDHPTEEINVGTAAFLHSLLMDDEKSNSAGRLRDQPVWLGSPTAKPENAVFVPPVGEAILSSLKSWEDFLKMPPRLPILIRAAMIHYQFLTIHPFMDGNGRVGRMLVLLFLRNESRFSVPLLYVSPYFAERRREYYDRLQAVREKGEMQQWLQFFLTAIATQANDGVWRAQTLLELRERYRAELSGNRSRAVDVVETLFTHPIITTSLIRDKLSITSQGALNLIRALEGRGWLAPLTHASGRGVQSQWIANEVFEAITATEGDSQAHPSGMS